ncbi:MAG TPA: ABC transporter substrate-binding protein [Acidimicrobiales bacterium]|nr:ABC transporter substrate-binding protein [Acidimicrobiales bacterium]
MFRRVVASLFCLGLAASLLASPSAAQNQAGTKTVRVAIKGFENNITPFTVGFGALPATNDIQHMVYDSLFWSQVKANPEPWLARSADTSDGGRTWDVTLRDDVKWHDGVPFTADDVAFSFDYYKKQAGSSGRYSHHVFDTPSYDHAEIQDPHHLRMFFSQPAPQFKIMPGGDLPIVAKHIYENVADPAKMTTQLPVGTGPFKLTEIVPDQRYKLVANKDYFKGAPEIDELDLVVIKDPGSAFTGLRTGDVDMVERTVPPELVNQLDNTPGINVAKSSRFESTQLYFNARKPPLSDPKLRKAISMGMDLDALVKTVMLGHARVGRDSYLHPDSPWAIPGGGHEHDAAGAAKMLDDAGYTAKDPDGVRKAPDGKRLEFSVLVSSFEPTDIRSMQLVASQLQPLGVKLNVETLDPATLRQRRAAQTGGIPAYDMYVSSIESHAHVDPDALYYFFHSPGPKGFGGTITGYTNPEFDKLVEEATGKEAAQRKALLAQAQGILAKEVPLQVLYYPDGLYAYRTAAYSGWAADPGHGIFTKRSFLNGYADLKVANASSASSATSKAKENGAPVGAIVGIVLVCAVALLGVGLLMRRRQGPPEPEE